MLRVLTGKAMGYVEKERIFQVRVSDVLLFISICDLFTESSS
jgi:hypothetical protein